MHVDRYRWILILQYSLLFVDLFINSFIGLLNFKNIIILLLHVLQDVCILFAAIILFLLFFNTYIFQAGLVSVLVRKFKFTIIVTFIYFALCVGLHVWSLTLKWSDPKIHIENKLYWLLNGFQKMGSLVYYYEYKRTALKLGDSRFYHSSEWLKEEFQRRN